MGARRATDRQVVFLRDLLSQTEGHDRRDVIAEQVARHAGGRDLSLQQASDLIDRLLTMREGLRSADEPPEAIHYAGGTVFKVQRSKRSGKLYAKRFVPETEDWTYEGRSPLYDPGLSPETVMTVEDAMEFGKRFGICVRCGATLTDPKSVEQGIGPVCIKRIGEDRAEAMVARREEEVAA